jgi:hypothetical protein
MHPLRRIRDAWISWQRRREAFNEFHRQRMQELGAASVYQERARQAAQREARDRRGGGDGDGAW